MTTQTNSGTPAAPAPGVDPAAPGGPAPGVPAEGAAPEGTTPEGTDGLILGKFADQAELEAAYTALASQQGGEIDLTEFSTEFETTGDVSPENIAKIVEMLAPMGLGEDVVKAYIDGQKALKAGEGDAEDKALEGYGGKEGAQAMIDWAEGAMTEQEFGRYAEVLQGDDMDKAMFALDAIKARYDAAQTPAAPAPVADPKPKLISGAAAAAAAANSNDGAFSNEAEMRAAIRDPRYKSDPVYRDATIKRILATE